MAEAINSVLNHWEELSVFLSDGAVEMRQQQSAPVLAELHDKFFTWKGQLLPKHPSPRRSSAEAFRPCFSTA